MKLAKRDFDPNSDTADELHGFDRNMDGIEYLLLGFTFYKIYYNKMIACWLSLFLLNASMATGMN